MNRDCVTEETRHVKQKDGECRSAQGSLLQSSTRSVLKETTSYCENCYKALLAIFSWFFMRDHEVKIFKCETKQLWHLGASDVIFVGDCVSSCLFRLPGETFCEKKKNWTGEKKVSSHMSSCINRLANVSNIECRARILLQRAAHYRHGNVEIKLILLLNSQHEPR
jgi:hypothetical protein